jgi:ubiquinone/menaquinone biosynthesis C-methylase UbiE
VAEISNRHNGAPDLMDNRQNQSEIFLQGEGDGYFDRNKSALNAEGDLFCEELICETLAPFKPEINRVLEIGCANGVKLEYLCKFFDAAGAGLDPSPKAVSAGNERLSNSHAKNLTLAVGGANKLPFDKREFDLVYFAFCLYLVDRDDLFAAIAEADRVLRPGGFLAIVDFDPADRHKRAYHHKAGVFSYKQQYADLFTHSGHYHLVSKHSLSHAGHAFVKDSGERVSLCILYKEPDAYPLHHS